MKQATIFFIVGLIVLICITYGGRVEIDVSWDFGENEINTGWGNATAEQSDVETKVENGELRCSIIGFQPVIDSPLLFLNITRRHYVLMRAKHLGSAHEARLLLRSGVELSPNENLNFKSSYWNTRQKMTAIADSGSTEGFGRQYISDGDPYTIFSAPVMAFASVVFDLGDTRMVTKIRILSSGDEDSPKRCVLQKSVTSGIGPFETVSSFALAERTMGHSGYGDENGTAGIYEQSVGSFSGTARFWRLLVLDNHGGSNITIREVALDGYDEKVTPVPFALDSSGEYVNYYLPINTYLSGYLLRMRFELLYTPEKAVVVNTRGKVFRESFHIDHIRVVRAPEIWKVRGCLDQYYKSPNYMEATYNITHVIDTINGILPIHAFDVEQMSLQYAATLDCPNAGDIPLHIEGINFGDDAVVTVGGRRCHVSSNKYFDYDGRVQELICSLPEYVSAEQAARTGQDVTTGGTGQSNRRVMVRVENAVHSGLFHEVPSLQYRVAPAVPERPTITNIGARRVDLTWKPPRTSDGGDFDQMVVTGYKIIWFQPKYASRVSNLTVGNVTTTSVRGLEPETEYVFAIAAMAEGAREGSAKLPTDLYARRSPSADALLGTFSTYTNITSTLRFDFDFNFFSANSTLNASGSTASESLGPTGQFGSEGNYGLVLVGSANIENCNVSSTCCDSYNASIGISSCGTLPSVCAVLPARMLAYDLVEDGVTRRGVPTNLPYENGAPPEIQIVTLAELIANKGADLPASKCGPALRLTPSAARSSGATWYRRKMDVREGFDTFVKFQISNPSQKCDRLDDVNTYCRSRGADGLAFVMQNVAPDALGNAGKGLGYEGIFNSLSVELDTFHNYENMDYYENHISVQTQGFRYNITANHSRSLATSNRVPDLTDGKHTVRIKYDPNFDESAVLHPSFQVNGFATWFINNADYGNGGEGDWGTGFGLLYVYIDDMYSPIITTPLNLGATLTLDQGRAWVGVTAATGDEYWQTHDVLSWQFSSLYIDERYEPPAVVNNDGDHRCVNETVCVHRVDYSHYMRTNSIWGKGSDSTEGWMTGEEGFCAFC